MVNNILHFYNLDPDEDIQESLRLALMFKEELDEAVGAYMEMLQLSIENSDQTPEEITNLVQEAINAALVSGIRAYRSFMREQGVKVHEVETYSGKDIPSDFFHPGARWPL